MAFGKMKMIGVALVAALSCGFAAAQTMTLYKLIDRDGKVTYSEEKPKEFDGKVVPIEIDMSSNRATMPKYTSPSSSQVSAKKAQENRVEKAKNTLAQRKAELEDAINNPREEDIGRMGTVGGFARPVPTEAYLKRLADMEKRVKAAEDELSAAEGKK